MSKLWGFPLLRRLVLNNCKYLKGDIKSPKVRDTWDKIYVKDGYGLMLGRPIPDTNSMLPTFDAGHAVIFTRDFDFRDLQVGDIVQTTWKLHRIIEIGEDREGWYAITAGDNTVRAGSVKNRKEDIDQLILGILY